MKKKEMAAEMESLGFSYHYKVPSNVFHAIAEATTPRNEMYAKYLVIATVHGEVFGGWYSDFSEAVLIRSTAMRARRFGEKVYADIYGPGLTNGRWY